MDSTYSVYIHSHKIHIAKITKDKASINLSLGREIGRVRKGVPRRGVGGRKREGKMM